MRRGFAKILILVVFVLILVIVFLLREIMIYDVTAKVRFNNRFKKTGWFDEKVSLSTAEIQDTTTMIALAIGQSNAASTSNKLYEPHNEVLSYYNGMFYKAKEPLLGSGGDGGCVWTILADKLIDSNIYKRVILVPIAVGSTSIENWISGPVAQKLDKVLDELNKNGIKLTHIFWHQGESDTGSDKLTYKTNLKTLVDKIWKNGQRAPFYCSVATYNAYINNGLNGVDTTLQCAQTEFVHENQNVLLGPNTDKLIFAIDRYDGQHFSGIGNLKYADLWFQSIAHPKE